MSVLRACGSLTGKLSPKASLSGTIRAVSTGGASGKPYEGEYEVTPKAFEAQTLPTAGKVLANDILVDSIPYFEVSNTTGGITVNIAERVNRNARRGV